MLKELKNMYTKINCKMDIKNIEGHEVGLLYLGKRKDLPDIVILEKPNYSTLSDIKEVTMLLYTIGEEVLCNKFHLITSNLPKKSILKELALLNIKVSDYKHIESIKKDIEEGKYIELLPHNEYVIKEAESLLKKYNKAAIIQATGTGKSFIIGRFLVNESYGRKLIITPSKYIKNQIIKYFGEIINNNVEFLTYSKLSTMVDTDLENLTFDTIILDEFHRAGASKWEKSVKKLIDFNEKAYLIGTTATPRRYLDNDRDMVKELFDGISTEEIDVSSAIARGILPNPKYVYSLFNFGSEIDDAIKLVKNGKYNEKEEHLQEHWIKTLTNFKLNWENSKGLNDVIKNYLRKDGKNKFIVFCSSISHIDDMRKEFSKHLHDNGFVLENEEIVYTGLSGNEKRLSNFENYKIKKSNGVSLLFCIDMLSEGVHISSTNKGTPLLGVFLMRNTVSPIIFYQQIGRALSSNMKETPMIFDLTNNCASIKTRFFQGDLKDNENLINKVRRRFGINPINYASSIDIRCIDVLSLLSTIKSKFELSWEKRIEELKSFIAKNGHAAISKSNADESLVTWAQGLRARYTRCELSQEQVITLNSLGFVWDMLEYNWQQNLKGLEQFKDEDGFIVSVNKNINRELHNLATSLRSKYRKGLLDKDKINDLEAIGFVWEIEEHKWNIMYNKLIAYNKERDEAKKNFKMSKPQCPKLKNWVTIQRARYERGALSEEEIDKLRQQNVAFLQDKNIWMESYKKYLQGMSMPKEKRPSYVYAWTCKQRKLYEEGKLTDEQIRIVKDLGIELIKSEDKFWYYLDELVKYKEEHGNCRVFRTKVTNKKFFSWYANLKTSFDNLSKEKQDALLSVGYKRYTRDSDWDKNIELYKKIKHKKVVDLSNEELKAYRWACRVRYRYKAGKIDKEREKEVKELILA